MLKPETSQSRGAMQVVTFPKPATVTTPVLLLWCDYCAGVLLHTRCDALAIPTLTVAWVMWQGALEEQNQAWV